MPCATKVKEPTFTLSHLCVFHSSCQYITLFWLTYHFLNQRTNKMESTCVVIPTVGEKVHQTVLHPTTLQQTQKILLQVIPILHCQLSLGNRNGAFQLLSALTTYLQYMLMQRISLTTNTARNNRSIY